MGAEALTLDGHALQLTAHVVDRLVELMDPIVKIPIPPDNRRRGCNSSCAGRPTLVPASLCLSKQPPGKTSSTNNSSSQNTEAGTATGWVAAVVIAHKSIPVCSEPRYR